MPVLSMNEAAWDESNVMLSNGQEMSGIRQPSGMMARSQDDAMVGYFSQRPQTDVAQQYNHKRWAVGDDSVIEQVRNVGVHELERDFQNMGFESHREAIASNAKKIWDADVAGKAGGDPKAIFAPSSPWIPRDDTWGNAPHPRPNHAVSTPMHIAHRRPGSFPGSDPASILSPRSSETGALGVNMAEYVLGGSPVGKDFRRAYVPGGDGDGQKGVEKGGKAASPFEGGDKSGGQEPKDVQSNGIMQNGQDDKLYRPGPYNRTPGSRQNSPTEEDGRVQQVLNDPVKMQQAQHHQLSVPKLDDYSVEVQQPVLPQPGLNIETPQFEPVGIDSIPFDYSSQLMPPSMESPNFNVDYSQQMSQDYQAQLLQRQQQQQQQQQQPMAILNPQQYALAAQQQQLGLAPTAAFTPAPYVLSGQDPYPVGIPIAAAGPGAAVVPQYYSVQTPWGIYPAASLLQQGNNNQQVQQQQQQQLLRGQTGRLTPSQDGLGTPTGNLQSQPTAIQTPGTAGYQILAPAYYDQNGQLVMSTGRGMGTPVRLVSPAPILVNAGQQGTTNGLGGNALRLLTTQQQQVQGSPVYTSSTTTPQNTPLGQAYTPNSTGLYTPVSSSLFNPISSTLGLNQQQAAGYNSGSLGSIGTSSTPGAIGSGVPAQRRDSLSTPLDFKNRSGLPAAAALGQYYGLSGTTAVNGGPLGVVQPNHSLTPPPNLTGSAGNLGLGGMGSSSRIYSAAPGAEAKYRNGSLPNANGLFAGSSLFPSRMLAKNASMSKEVTGRSRLLEDFRNNRIPNLQLKDLINHVVEFSQDQHGSRFIQQKLERATPAEKAMVFTEILTAAYSLMTDVFGNYVIQKFFEFGTPDQKQTLAQRVRGHVLPLALQMYGCRVIQKALESIPAEMQVEIVKELDGHVLKCVKDQNGNHVVQKCIECVEPKHLQFIIDAFKSQVFALSTHPYGCRVIQRILEHCTGDQTLPILEELHQHTERLVQDQYGNYVIQHVLEHGRPEDKTKIVSGLRGRVLSLSQHKFASNVVEKCVSHSSRQERACLIDEICSVNDGALYTMMKDQFANYVVQKMIDVAEPAQRKLLMHKIRPHVATLRKYTYGKHILAKLEKYYMKNADLGPIGMPPNGALQ